MVALDRYLHELLVLAPAVSESDALYTFLHTTRRDDNDTIERMNSVRVWVVCEMGADLDVM